jgi:hypothetical protein
LSRWQCFGFSGGDVMPVELVELLSVENYNYLMGLAGIAAGFVVCLIWSQGL